MATSTNGHITATPDVAEPGATDTGGRTWASILELTVREEIIQGKLPAGSKLRLKELSERYQAGVIPLREALSRLCATGFVVAIDQKGFRVAELSESELLDITRVRQQIETQALRDAIGSANVAWEGQLIAAHHRLKRIPMYLPGEGRRMNPDWEDAHSDFHAALVAGCESPWLRRFSALLRDQTARYRLLSMNIPKSGRKRDVMAEHQAIVDAAVRGDADGACRLLHEHFQVTTDLVMAHLAAQKAAGAGKAGVKKAAAV
ncbi:GntR family transcriptional regulator [Cupriavidus basilensis OR16]|uniref:GntR family transcriptional regulator n=1 Tax=Cupriavidus basilensis OR16 TaxID=1127483 RepID=H1S5R5_9BURK|nr:GntR family transcriptional regulator [Cupriavidus basilensis OR16]